VAPVMVNWTLPALRRNCPAVAHWIEWLGGKVRDQKPGLRREGDQRVSGAVIPTVSKRKAPPPPDWVNVLAHLQRRRRPPVRSWSVPDPTEGVDIERAVAGEGAAEEVDRAGAQGAGILVCKVPPTIKVPPVKYWSRSGSFRPVRHAPQRDCPRALVQKHSRCPYGQRTTSASPGAAGDRRRIDRARPLLKPIWSVPSELASWARVMEEAETVPPFTRKRNCWSRPAR